MGVMTGKSKNFSVRADLEKAAKFTEKTGIAKGQRMFDYLLNYWYNRENEGDETRKKPHIFDKLPKSVQNKIENNIEWA